MNTYSRLFIILLLLIRPDNIFSQQELTLDEARQMARENNLQIRIAAEQQQATGYMQQAARSKFFPSFDIGAQYLRMNKPFHLLDDNLFLPVVPADAINFETGEINPAALLQSNPPALALDQAGNPMFGPDGNFLFSNYAYIPRSAASIGQENNLLFSFNLAQPLFTGGKIRAQYQAANHAQDISKAAADITLAEILLQTDTLFWKMVTLQEKQALAEQYVEMLESLVKDVENYTQEGITSQNDMLRARIALNEAQLQRTKATNGVIQVNMALNKVMGVSLTQKYIAIHDADKLPPPGPLEDLWQRGLKTRPEISAITSQTGLSEALARVARGAMLPNVALGANYFASNPNPYNGFDKSFGHDWVAGITVTMPVYHFGERRNLYKAALRETAARQMKLKETHDLIRLDITQAFYDYAEALEEIDIKQLSVEQAERNMAMANDLFDVGKLKTTDLLEAQTLLNEARTNLLESRAKARKKHARLQKATAQQL
jgi:outer membrane protein TolC